MEETKEEIKARLPVEDVIGDYIELKRAGRGLKGRSPWGVDKTPSFMVSPEKGIWHDFSANKGGDIFTFIMEVEGISFREALEKLAARAGVELSKYSGGDKEIARRKVRAREALELATKYYQFALSKNKAAIDYVFYKRNMNKATVREFRIGYAPNAREALVRFLKSKGFTASEMEAAGLLNQYGGDLFRGRMMVPFFEASGGAIIGYTARTLEKDGIPKYLNTPDTLLFNKSRFIFGLYQAKPAIREKGYVVIVEGNMDVISSHQAGVKTAVATSGTAMTEQHLKMLSRLTSDVRLAYDGDEAGMRATERAINLAGSLGVTLSVISDYHGCKDPDELIQKDPLLWQEAVSKSVPAVDYLLGRYEETLNLATATGKKEYSDVAVRLISYLKDPVEKKHYEKLVASRLDVSIEDLMAKKASFETGARRKFYKKVKNAEVGPASRIAVLSNRLKAIQLFGGEAGAKLDFELPEDEVEISELSLVFETEYGGYDEKTLARIAMDLRKEYEKELVRERVSELSQELSKYEDDEEKTAEILREIKKLRAGQ
ncbi:DNA primase [Candidatus Saccharibacteria bacterium]|nr:DNA primase [Candidatus Saccharibacteria bacterium]